MLAAPVEGRVPSQRQPLALEAFIGRRRLRSAPRQIPATQRPALHRRCSDGDLESHAVLPAVAALRLHRRKDLRATIRWPGPLGLEGGGLHCFGAGAGYEGLSVSRVPVGRAALPRSPQIGAFDQGPGRLGPVVLLPTRSALSAPPDIERPRIASRVGRRGGPVSPCRDNWKRKGAMIARPGNLLEHATASGWRRR